MIRTLPWSDADELGLVAPLLPEAPIIIEAGVNDAQDTPRMAELWPQGHIYGFEPHPGCFDTSLHRLRHYPNVTLTPCALGAVNDMVDFYIPTLNSGASSLFTDNTTAINYHECYHDRKIRVECRTLEAWCKASNITHIDFMWLDTEGAELDILRHSGPVLSTVKAIYTELNFREYRKHEALAPSVCAYLHSIGFTPIHGWGNPDEQATVLFVRRL